MTNVLNSKSVRLTVDGFLYQYATTLIFIIVILGLVPGIHMKFRGQFDFR